jgi:hypothetical protein
VSGTDPGALLWISPQLAEDEQHVRDDDWWLLERRHEDGKHWVEVVRFTNREDAEGRLARFVADGMPRDQLRVARVRLVA